MRILKTEIPIDDQWHQGEMGEIVHVGHQNFGVVTVWWKDTAPRRIRLLRVYGTGHDIRDYDPVHLRNVTPEYVGTAIDLGRGLVWHLIENLA